MDRSLFYSSLFELSSASLDSILAGAYDIGSCAWQVWERVLGTDTLEGDSLLKRKLLLSTLRAVYN